MSELLLLGTSHKTAPLALRERIALLDGGAEQLVKELTAHDSIAEAVALRTRGCVSCSAIRTARKLSGTKAPPTIAKTAAVRACRSGSSIENRSGV